MYSGRYVRIYQCTYSTPGNVIHSYLCNPSLLDRELDRGAGVERVGPRHGETAGHVSYFLDLFRFQGAAQEFLFPIGKPLLDDLISTDVIIPDLFGDVAPVGYIIQKGLAKPDEILLLAFARDVHYEMERRINERLGVHLNVQTFHALGLTIIAESTGTKLSVSELAAS